MLLLPLLLASALAAQDPIPQDEDAPPPDTIPPPTVQVPIPPERLPADTFTVRPPEMEEDSIIPAPRLPRLLRPATAGWSEGVWEWGPEELGRFQGFSLLELLERVPGLVITRGGGIGRPAALSAFGLGGGRLRVFLDGYELDPLATANLELQQIPLVDLESVRVARGLREVRIELYTFQLTDLRPFSQIEAGTGDYQSRFLRGLFSRAVGGRSVLTLGFDLVDTEGRLRTQPFTATTGVVRWAYFPSARAGLEAEYRQTGVVRELRGAAPVGEEFGRRDLILRARARPLADVPGLTVEGMFGRSWQPPAEGEVVEGPSALALEVNQAAGRLDLDAGALWLSGGARLRGGQTGYIAPGLDLSLAAALRPAAWFSAGGEVRHATAGGESGLELEGGVRLSPHPAFSLFASAATGQRALALARDSIVELVGLPNGEPPPADTLTLFSTLPSGLNGFRAGAEWAPGWGGRVGAAYLALDTDRILPFGLPFDRRVAPFVGDAASGVEAYLSVPLFYRPLRAEGAYTRWLETGGWPYLPEEEWRAGLTFHGLYYTGNLEPTIRAEVVRRGASIVPTPEGDAFSALADPYTLLNFYMQIRVLSVRAFVTWDNILNAQVADVPGRLITGQRALYGVKWYFYN